jgi:hypothetical protein
MVVRIGFGLALTFAGIAHYQDPTYAEAVGRGLGVLEPLGMIWGYILPGLMILGGLLLAFGIYMHIGAWAAGLALASIPAGLMLKSAVGGVSMNDTMPLAMNAFIWIAIFLMVTKKGCGTGCCCGMDNCNCGDEPPAKVSSAKSVPVVPVASRKPAPKKRR